MEPSYWRLVIRLLVCLPIRSHAPPESVSWFCRDPAERRFRCCGKAWCIWPGFTWELRENQTETCVRWSNGSARVIALRTAKWEAGLALHRAWAFTRCIPPWKGTFAGWVGKWAPGRASASTN